MRSVSVNSTVGTTVATIVALDKRLVHFFCPNIARIIYWIFVPTDRRPAYHCVCVSGWSVCGTRIVLISNQKSEQLFAYVDCVPTLSQNPTVPHSRCCDTWKEGLWKFASSGQLLLYRNEMKIRNWSDCLKSIFIAGNGIFAQATVHFWQHWQIAYSMHLCRQIEQKHSALPRAIVMRERERKARTPDKNWHYRKLRAWFMSRRWNVRADTRKRICYRKAISNIECGTLSVAHGISRRNVRIKSQKSIWLFWIMRACNWILGKWQPPIVPQIIWKNAMLYHSQFHSFTCILQYNQVIANQSHGTKWHINIIDR